MPPLPLPTLRQRFTFAALNFFAGAAFRSSPSIAPGKSEEVGRILVLELWNIGDVILTMPFLAQLRGLFPRAKISLVARPFAPELLRGTGLVDELIIADLTWGSDSHIGLGRKAIDLWRLSRKLRGREFDVAFSSRLHVGEHFLIALSGAKRKVGFALGERDRALTDAITPNEAPQQKVDEWMRLLGPFGGAVTVLLPRLHVDESERQWAKGYLTSRGIGGEDLLVGIHPGASVAEKRWPLERFREVAAATAGQPGVRVLAFAEPGGYGSELFTIPQVVGAQGTLRELIALVERCGLLVCNDSGPMHIAGALGVPTIAMFGEGIDQWFSPLGHGHEALRPNEEEQRADPAPVGAVIRAPRGIRSSRVVDAVGRALQRLRAPGTFSSV